MAWNGTVWCWIFPNNTTCYTSTDLVTWNAQPAALPVAGESPYICSDGTQFCYVPGLAAGSTVAATSPDGITWTTRTLPASGQWTWCSYDVDRFVALRQSATTNGGAYSTTGASWTGVALAFAKTGRLSTVRLSTSYQIFGSESSSVLEFTGFGSGGGSGNSSGVTFISTNGCATNGTIKVAAGSNAGAAINYVKTTTVAGSYQDTDWTSRTLPYSRIWGQVDWDGTYFILPSTTDGIVCYSTDGITWLAKNTTSTGAYYTISKGTTGYTVLFDDVVNSKLNIFNTGLSQPSVRIDEILNHSLYVSSPVRMALSIIETITDMIKLSGDYEQFYDTGWRSPTTNTLYDNNSGTTWTNPANAYSQDGIYATNTSASGRESDYIDLNTYGFTIPLDANIEGIQTAVRIKSSGTGCSARVMLWADSISTKIAFPDYTDHTTDSWFNITTTDTTYTFGATSGGYEAGWQGGWYNTNPGEHLTITPAEINDAQFGAEFKAYNGSAASRTFSLDSILIRVFYSIRGKNFRTTIAEAVAYAMDLTTEVGYTLLSFTVAEAEALTIAAARKRGITLTQAEVESIALDALKRSRNHGTMSIPESEAITDSIIRTRTEIFSLSEIEAFTSIPVRRTRSEALSVAETEALNAAIKRTTRSLPFGISETYAITNALSRLKQESFSNSITESISSIALKRIRSETFTIAEAEAIVAAASRLRSEVLSIVESIVYIVSLGGPQKPLSFSINEVETMVLTAIRARKVVVTDSIIEAMIVTTLNRIRKDNFTVSETESITLPLARLRSPGTMAIIESESISSSLARVKKITLALAETLGYTFAINKLKVLSSFTVAETEGFSFGDLRRTRTIASALNEVINYAITRINKSRSVVTTIAETEAITEALTRVRVITASMAELEALTIQLARKKQIAMTMAELESVSASLARMKLVSYIIQQTDSVSNMFLRRVRSSSFAVTELETEQANFNRARALLLPINESEQMTLNVGRIREQIVTIAETQGVSIALSRLLQLVQTISNTLDYTIELKVYPDILNPAEIGVTLEWVEWRNISCGLLNSTYDLIDKSMTFNIVNKTTSNSDFIQETGSTEVGFVTATSSIAPFSIESGGTTTIVPNGIF